MEALFSDHLPTMRLRQVKGCALFSSYEPISYFMAFVGCSIESIVLNHSIEYAPCISLRAKLPNHVSTCSSKLADVALHAIYENISHRFQSSPAQGMINQDEDICPCPPCPRVNQYTHIRASAYPHSHTITHTTPGLFHSVIGCSLQYCVKASQSRSHSKTNAKS